MKIDDSILQDLIDKIHDDVLDWEEHVRSADYAYDGGETSRIEDNASLGESKAIVECLRELADLRRELAEARAENQQLASLLESAKCVNENECFLRSRGAGLTRGDGEMMFKTVDEMIAHVEKEIPEDAEQLKEARDVVLVVAVNRKLRRELDAARAEAGRLRKACEEFRGAVLHQRWQLEEPCLDNDQTNAVLGLFDDVFALATPADASEEPTP